MAMSKDRVRFTLSYSHLKKQSGHSRVTGVSMTWVLDRVFGPPEGYSCWQKYVSCLHFDSEVVVICRPSQFARFLIERNNRGFHNDFKSLRPELFCPDRMEPRLVQDVSCNPNKLHGDRHEEDD